MNPRFSSRGAPCVRLWPSRRDFSYTRGVRSAPLAFALVLAACGGSDLPPGSDAGIDVALDDAGMGTLTSSVASVELPTSPIGGAAVTAQFMVSNPGGAVVELSSVTIVGDAGFSLVTAPSRLQPGTSARVTVRFAGSSSRAFAVATIRFVYAGGELRVPLSALVVAPSLPTPVFEAVTAADGSACGEGTTVQLASAPFPDPSGPYTDASVRVFVPSGYRRRGSNDVLLHFHGHSTTLATELASHQLEAQVCASGANVVLVVPQGPVNAPSGNFGKLMSPSGTRALIDDVLAILYGAGRIGQPQLGSVHLAAHSGGYLAVAANADAPELPVESIALFDALYGNLAVFEAYGRAGGRLVSNYTDTGGTLLNNQNLAAVLSTATNVSEDAFFADLLGTEVVISRAPTTHARATRFENAYGNALRFRAPSTVSGGRIELVRATATSGTATVTFQAPPDPDRLGFDVEASTDGATFSVVASLGPTATSATFALAGPRHVRVRARMPGATTTQTSDTYAVASDARVLIVDAFDRVLGGSYSGRSHPFAADVGVPLAASTVSSRALVEGGFALAGYEAVVWLAGDASTDDRPIDPDEQGVLTAYLDGGGRLVASGSEIAYALAGDPFLATFGASYAADDAGASDASATAALGSLPALTFVYAAAPYVEDYPDVLGLASGVALADYPGGAHAAVGVANRAALVGFPVELLAEPARTDFVRALLAFTGVSLP